MLFTYNNRLASEVINIYGIQQIAEWFLAHEAMSAKKMQELTYYVQGWSNALFKHPIIDTDFQAWIHGSVSYELWKKYHSYGETDIPQNKNYVNQINDVSVEDLLEAVWITYGDKNANELVALTHRELPWIIARCNGKPYVISNNVMGKFYHSIMI